MLILSLLSPLTTKTTIFEDESDCPVSSSLWKLIIDKDWSSQIKRSVKDHLSFYDTNQNHVYVFSPLPA